MLKPYEVICQLVKEKDEAKLAAYIKEHDINALHDREGSIVKLLAEKGEVDVVNLLLQKYEGNVRSALYGYALVGNHEQVDALVQVYGAFPDRIAMGYAQGKNHDKVEEWISKGATLDSAVEGYAQAKDYQHVEAMLARGASIQFAVAAYARVGDVAAVNNLIARGASPRRAVHAYVLGGYIDSATQLCLQIKLLGKLDASQAIDEKTMIISMLRGHAVYDREEQVNALTNEDNKKSAIFNYATGGHVEKVNKLLALPDADDKDLGEAIMGYIYNGRVSEANNLLHQSNLTTKNSVYYSLFEHAYVGDKRRVDGLLEELEDYKKAEIHAIHGYAMAGRTNYLEEIIHNSSSIPKQYINAAVDGYDNGYYLESEKRILMVLRQIKDYDLQVSLAEAIAKKTGFLANDLLRKAKAANPRQPEHLEDITPRIYIKEYAAFENNRVLSFFDEMFSAKKLDKKIEKYKHLLDQETMRTKINWALGHLLYEKSFYVDGEERSKLLKSALAHIETAKSFAKVDNSYLLKDLRRESILVFSQWLDCRYRLGMKDHRHDYDEYVSWIKQMDTVGKRVLYFQITMRAILDEYQMIEKKDEYKERLAALKKSYKQALTYYVDDIDKSSSFIINDSTSGWSNYLENKDSWFESAQLINCSNVLFSLYMKGFFLYFQEGQEGHYEKTVALFKGLPYKNEMFEKCKRVLACVFGDDEKRYEFVSSLLAGILKNKKTVPVSAVSIFNTAPTAPKMDEAAREAIETRYGFDL